MKIAVLSDTHGLLRPEVKDIISQCDAVIHGGDINSQNIIDEITEVKPETAPLYIVRGNNDKEWAEALPMHEEFVVEGWKFYLVHNKKDVPAELGDVQIVIYGHSHKYAQEIKDERLWLNPGSCGKRRFHQDITMAILHIDQEGWTVECIDIPHEGKGDKAPVIPEKDTLQMIEHILRRLDKGQQVGRIAKELRLDVEFVEQVGRIKVTHPGVDAHGILDKMEVNRTGR